MESPLEIEERRELLVQMVQFSSFGGLNQEDNLNWLIEDINHVIKEMGLRGHIVLDLSHSK